VYLEEVAVGVASQHQGIGTTLVLEMARWLLETTEAKLISARPLGPPGEALLNRLGLAHTPTALTDLTGVKDPDDS